MFFYIKQLSAEGKFFALAAEFHLKSLIFSLMFYATSVIFGRDSVFPLSHVKQVTTSLTANYIVMQHSFQAEMSCIATTDIFGKHSNKLSGRKHPLGLDTNLI